jgi:hypothetical protein
MTVNPENKLQNHSMMQNNPFQNRQSANPFYLFALLGGLLRWLLLGSWRGEQLLTILKDDNYKKNIIFFFIILVIVLGIYFISINIKA